MTQSFRHWKRNHLKALRRHRSSQAFLHRLALEDQFLEYARGATTRAMFTIWPWREEKTEKSPD